MLYHKRGKKERNSIQYLVLEAISVSGQLARDIITERVIKLFGRSLHDTRKTDPRYDISRSVRRLIEAGYICIKVIDGEQVLALTTKGKLKRNQIASGKIKLTKQKKWDGKWRVIIYDIKENRRGKRNILRDTLVHLGFTLIQKSAWVYPYPCEELLAMIKADFGMGKEVLYMVVESLENDKWIKEIYHL